MHDDKLQRIRCDDCGRFVSYENAHVEMERRCSTLDACPIEDFMHAQCKKCVEKEIEGE